MKNLFLLVLLFISIQLNSQNKLDTSYFVIKGNYEEINKSNYILLNQKATHYSFFSTDGIEFYQIGIIPNYDKGSNSLDEIKRLLKGYSTISFQGVTAISSEREILSEGQLLYAKDIMFYKNNNFFSVLLVVNNKQALAKLYYKFQENFKAK